eukprot:CAMPEP_0176032152 /NCGR_PEP_ID=MMETSP0120_2-20121206/15866_1 /TAXON_ID=160619 /ORGANISM="Kryptoperidinium foliaceum, Strain CCMP 1326" /LENGTH=228 /DNA_ID=CAMNT_0017365465 /DNA_START=17 /DNA_END=700 /DNA_ORIENTATION=+
MSIQESSHSFEEPLLPASTMSRRHSSSKDEEEDSSVSSLNYDEPKNWKLSQFLRCKVLSAGFLFGYLAEYLYIAAIRKGYAKVHTVEDSKGRRSSTVEIQVDSWQDAILYEMSYMFTDVLFFIYVVVLLRAAMQWKKTSRPPLNLRLAINASNWVLGMVTGLIASVCSIVSVSKVFRSRYPEILACSLGGVFLCFVTYAAAKEFESQCVRSRDEEDEEEDEEEGNESD